MTIFLLKIFKLILKDMEKKNYTSLVLTKKWFNMILLDEKKEEYREIKKSYADRFLKKDFLPRHSLLNLMICFASGYITDNNLDTLKGALKNPPKYIIFYHAYAKCRPMMKLELKSIKIKAGKKKWGAVKGQKYFVLELGEIVEVANIKKCPKCDVELHQSGQCINQLCNGWSVNKYK